jgi:hypothetical protein
MALLRAQCSAAQAKVIQITQFAGKQRYPNC